MPSVSCLDLVSETTEFRAKEASLKARKRSTREKTVSFSFPYSRSSRGLGRVVNPGGRVGNHQVTGGGGASDIYFVGVTPR